MDPTTPTDPRSADKVRRAVWGMVLVLFVVVVGGSAVTTLWRQANWALVSGPNTVGEAGKVYFAYRVATGQSLFVSGDQPPYYASMHGPLLHASVGWIGRLLTLPQEWLYGVGRGISVLCTIGVVVLLGRLLRLLGAGRWWWLALVACVFSAEAMVEHAISYRPDHWLLLLSVACCYLLAAGGPGVPRRRWQYVVLAVVPAMAFFIKAPGIALTLPIMVSLLFERRYKAAAVTLAGSLVLLALAMLAIEMGSGGRFSQGLRSGMSMPISVDTYLRFMSAAQFWPAWLMPLVLIGRGLPMRGESQRRWMVVVAFFVCGYVVSAFASMRAGSNMYYFVDSYTYGLTMVVAWIADVVKRKEQAYAGAAGVALLFIAMFAGPLYRISRESFPITDSMKSMDVAVRISRRVGSERRQLANWINHNGWRCYSDDPGLDILLDKPQIVYPLMQTLMIRNGSMTMDDMVGPVRRQEYDVVAMSGIIWQHMDEDNLPQPFIQALFETYPPRRKSDPDPNKGYLLFVAPRHVHGGPAPQPGPGD